MSFLAPSPSVCYMCPLELKLSAGFYLLTDHMCLSAAWDGHPPLMTDCTHYEALSLICPAASLLLINLLNLLN